MITCVCCRWLSVGGRDGNRASCLGVLSWLCRVRDVPSPSKPLLSRGDEAVWNWRTDVSRRAEGYDGLAGEHIGSLQLQKDVFNSRSSSPHMAKEMRWISRITIWFRVQVAIVGGLGCMLSHMLAVY